MNVSVVSPRGTTSPVNVTADLSESVKVKRVDSIPGTLSKASSVEQITTKIRLVKPGPLSGVQRGFWVAVSVFLPLQVITKDEMFAEDVLDFLHSAYSTVWSLRLARSIKWVGGENLARLMDSIKPAAQEFFSRSIGYFIADFCYVLVQLTRGHVPHLAAGRLAHHTIQSAACFPAILGGPMQTSSACTYLSIAYLAEMSNMFLRINNLLKRFGAEKHPLWMTNFRTLLLTFFLGRVINFPFCTALIWRHRQNLPTSVRNLQLGFAVGGMALNIGWFGKLVQIYLRVSRKRSAPMELL